jgi:hypothetical protein
MMLLTVKGTVLTCGKRGVDVRPDFNWNKRSGAMIQLEQIDERLLRISDKEEASYEARTIRSLETPQGTASKAAIEDIERARDSIEEGCEILRVIVAQE